MIFEQIREIVAGTKTQTRRVMKPGERLIWDEDDGQHIILTSGGRIKWRVGQDYAVQPKRGYHGAYYDKNTGAIYGFGYEPYTPNAYGNQYVYPLRVKILSLHHDLLQNIGNNDALEEGVRSVTEYRKLWSSINKRPGICWDDNPMVWVINFEVLK